MSSHRTGQYTKKEGDIAWKVYRRYLAEQDALRNNGYGFQELVEAIAGLPRLVVVHIRHADYSWSVHFNGEGDVKGNPFRAALAKGGLDISHRKPPGFFHMRSLMLAIHQAGLQLGVLKIDAGSWKFLQQDDEVIEKMETVLKSVQAFMLTICFASAKDEGPIEVDQDRREAIRFLSSNRPQNSLHRIRPGPYGSIRSAQLEGRCSRLYMAEAASPRTCLHRHPRT